MKLSLLLRRVFSKVGGVSCVPSFKEDVDLDVIDYWNKRARKYGVRSVLNIGHSVKELKYITHRQKEHIFPEMIKHLKGNEETVLDFGCGPGRFTPDLAKIVQGKAIGVDPIEYFFEMAPRDSNVEYRLMREGEIPVDDLTIDVLWVCLVLGGIVDDIILERTVCEFDRVLKENALIVLAENTSNERDGKYWKFRSADYYQKLFYFANLAAVSSYTDLGETITIIIGNKVV